jgi:hypothetical protein
MLRFARGSGRWGGVLTNHKKCDFGPTPISAG